MSNNIDNEAEATKAYFDSKIKDYLPETVKIANEIAKQLPGPNQVFQYLTNTIKLILDDIPPAISLAGISSNDIDDIVIYIESTDSASDGKLHIFNESKLKKYAKKTMKYYTELQGLVNEIIKIYKFIICLEYLFKIRCMIDNKIKQNMEIPESIANNVTEFYNCIVCLTNPILNKIQYVLDNIKQNKAYTAKLEEQSKRMADDILQPEIIEKLLGTRDQDTNEMPIYPIFANDPAVYTDNIVLPEINYNLNKNSLKRTVGLTTMDIYNVVKASHNLPVKFNKLNRTNLDNQFVIYTRTAKILNVFIEDIVNESANNINPQTQAINWNAVTWNPEYLTHTKSAHDQDDDEHSVKLEDILLSVPMLRFKYVDDLASVVLAVNAIIDIKYRGDLAVLYSDVKRAQQEYEASKLDPTITPIRYYIVPASAVSFTNSYFTEIGYSISGGHKVSVIFDLETKYIMYHEPLDVNDQQITLADGKYINGVIYCLYNLFHNTGKHVYFRNYSFIDVYIDYNLQIHEHVIARRLDKLIINSRRKKIYKNKTIREYYKDNEELYEEYTTKNREFAFGFCGLWNYLLAFIIMVNPKLNIYNVFYMLHRIFHTEEYAFNFTKALIRSFANHVENMLDCKIEYIPLVKITTDALDNIRIQTGPTRPPGTVIEYLTNRIKYVERQPQPLTAYEDDSQIPLDTYFSQAEIEYLNKNKQKSGKKHDMFPAYAIWPIFKDISRSLAQSIGFKKRCDIKHANTANTLYTNYMTGKEKLIMFVNMVPTPNPGNETQ